MKENIIHMKLYLQIQDLKNLLQMPFLDKIFDELMADLFELEKQVINSEICMLIIEEDQTVANLLEEKFLYKTKNYHSFLLRNHIKLLKVATKELMKVNTDLIVFVISSESALKRTISAVEKINNAKNRPMIVLLKDQDNYWGQQNIVIDHVNRDNDETIEENGVCCLDFSSSKAIEAQKFMDNQLMYESNFFSVKQKIREIANRVLRESLTQKYVASYINILAACKTELDRQVHEHEQKNMLLKQMEERLTDISVGFGDEIKEKCIASCRVDCEKVSFTQKPDSMIIAKNLITQTVNESIEKIFNPQAGSIIEENLKIVENGYNSYITKLVQGMFWLSPEQKILLSDKYMPLYIENKIFKFPRFVANLNDFSPIVSSMDVAEVKYKMNDALKKSLYRYNLQLHHAIDEWLCNMEKKYYAQLNQLLIAIKESIDLSLEENNKCINEILSSETYEFLNCLLKNADNLDYDRLNS